MFKTRVKARSMIPIVIGIVCLAVLVVAAQQRKDQDAPSGKAKGEASVSKVLVLKMRQPGSPLTISQVIVDDSPDPLMPVIHCIIKNSSDKGIIAYSVKHEAVFGQRTGTFSGSVTFNPADRENPMRPGVSRQVEINGVKYGEMPQSVMLSVDFVEFMDGNRWGPDTLKNGETIDGARAGARAETDALMKVLMTGGTEAVLLSLDSIHPEPDQTLPRSSEWLDGFRGGVGWIRERVRAKGHNLNEVEKELRRSVDLTGWR